MRRRVSLPIAIAVGLIGMTLTFVITMLSAMRIFDRTVADVKEKEFMYSKIAEIDAVVRGNYAGNVENAYLFDMLGIGYMAGLKDADSRFFTPQEMADLEAEKAGTRKGIGVEVIKDAANYARVVRVYEGSPAKESGFNTETRIASIGGLSAKTLPIETVREMLKGEIGTTVKLTVLIDNAEKTVDVVHKQYEERPVEGSLSEDGTKGFIKIIAFNEHTPALFDSVMRGLISKGAKSLVFDLRDVSGGSLDQAARCLDVLCPTGTLLSAKYKDGRTEVLYNSDAADVTLPMVCITNKQTSGPAEFFAAALRDLQKASLVGQKTAGSGNLQKLFRLSYGAGLQITTAQLIPPSGNPYHQLGVAPNYESSLPPQQDQLSYLADLKADPQIQRAFQVAEALVRNQQPDAPPPAPAPSAAAPAASAPAATSTASSAASAPAASASAS